MSEETIRCPAEWEPQEAVWLSWREIGAVKDRTYVAPFETIIKTLLNHVNVNLLVNDGEEESRVQTLLSSIISSSFKYRLNLIKVPHEDIWIRDNGPIFLLSSNNGSSSYTIATFDWNYWGYKWNFKEEYEGLDGKIGEVSAKLLNLPIISAGIVSEGGDREFNGKGTLIVCEAVELQRNPGKTKEEIEEILKRVFHIKKVIWLKKGVAEDEQAFRGKLPGGYFPCTPTGGHVDEFARFVNENTVLLAHISEEEAKVDPIAAISRGNLEENYAILQKETDQDGNPLNIVRIPMPPAIHHTVTPQDRMYQDYQTLKFEDGTVLDGVTSIQTVLPSSYCNFLITNGLVLAAKYYKEGRGQEFLESDNKAKEILEKLFPDRKVVQLDVENINLGGGGIHCMSQQQPSLGQ